MKRNGMSRRALLGNIAMLGVAAGSGKAVAKTHRFSPVQQPFSDPYLELVRLLKEGAEIEQDLMLQVPLCGVFHSSPHTRNSSALRCRIRIRSWESSSRRCSTSATSIGCSSSWMLRGTHAPGHPLRDRRLSISLRTCTAGLGQPGQVHVLRSGSRSPGACEIAPERLGFALVDKLKASFGGTIPVNHVGKLYDAITESLGDLKQAPGAPKIDYRCLVPEHRRCEG